MTPDPRDRDPLAEARRLKARDPAPMLTDEQVEALLRLVFDADPMPEIAVVPPELLAELARRAREPKPAKASMSVAAARRNKRLRREAERHHTGP